MLVLDDLLVRPWLGLLQVIHDMALEQLYDIEAIQSDLKENRLLYELGERSTAEYERHKSELEAQLATAREVRDHLSGKVEVLE